MINEMLCDSHCYPGESFQFDRVVGAGLQFAPVEPFGPLEHVDQQVDGADCPVGDHGDQVAPCHYAPMQVTPYLNQ